MTSEEDEAVRRMMDEIRPMLAERLKGHIGQPISDDVIRKLHETMAEVVTETMPGVKVGSFARNPTVPDRVSVWLEVPAYLVLALEEQDDTGETLPAGADG